MRTAAIGIGLLAGAVIAVSAISSIYPDVPRRMKRDGKKMLHSAGRMCRLG